MSECVFCKIANREIESELVAEDERAVAFKDLSPQAPIHILIIPRTHISALSETAREDGDLLGQLLLMAGRVAEEQKLGPNYRVVINNGPQAGQSVFHLHLHLLGGRAFRWPPG